MTVRIRSLVAALAVAAALVPFAASLEAGAQLPPPGSAQSWFFAEGNTLPNWFEFITVINPDPNADITIDVEYQLEEPAGFPQGTRTRTLDVPAGQRRTLAVYDDLGRPTGAGAGSPGVYTGVSARLTSTANFVAERPMYFINNFDVGEVNGAHDALGVNAASETWYFAEGSTLQAPAADATGVTPGAAGQLRGFMPFFTMQNVSGNNANVTITYRTNNPDSVVEKRITVPNNARITTDIANAFNNPAYPGSLGPGFEGFGTSIASDQPIIVERPFYINREFPEIGFVNAASDERGALTANNTTQLFAEGTVLEGFFEFLTVFNPNTGDTNLELQYQVENQTSPVVRTLTVPALSRRTVQVYNEASEGGLGRTLANSSAPGSAGVSVKITSTNAVGFVAERPMYFIRDFGNGPINGSHDVLGAGVPDTSWFFAEGTLRNGFFEFITIQNPNAAPARARLDYFINDQPLQTNFRDLPANSRVTVVAFDPNSEGSLAQKLAPAPVPADVDFGLRVTSIGADGRPANSAPIVVERPMYVNAVIAGQPPAINGGHNTLGFQFPAGEVPPLPGQTPEAQVDLSVAKSAASTTVSGGQNVAYTVTVANSGPSDASDAVVVDTLPAGMEFVSATGPGATCAQDQTDPQIVRCTVDVDAGGSTQITITAQAECPGPATRTNSVNVSPGAGQVDTDSTDNQDSSDVTVNCAQPAAVLDVVKTASDNSVETGDEVTYTISVENTGDADATNVVISDTLPAGATPVRHPGCTSDGAGTITCTVGTLTPDEVESRNIVVTFDAPDTYTNNASASSPDAATDRDSEVVTVETPAPAPAALAVDKVGSDDTVVVGEQVTYTITVTNIGGSAANDVVVTDTLPVTATVVAGGTSPNCGPQVGNVITCTIGSLAPDDDGTATITVTYNAPGTMTNTVVADASNTPPVSDAAVTTVVAPPPAPELDVEKSAPATAFTFQDVTYTITVTNTVPNSIATDVTVTDTLPGGATFLDASDNCSQVVVGGQITCTIGTLEGGDMATATITVEFADAGPHDNTATVTSAEDATDTDVARTVVTNPLSIEKDDGDTPTLIGEEVTYTITATTSGTTLTNVVISDTLPPEAELVRAPECPTTVAGSLSCPQGDLGPNQVATTTITVTFDTPGTFTNTASVTSDSGGFARTTEPTTVDRPAPELAVEKAGPDEAFTFSDVTYTIFVTNTVPNSIATNVILTDDIPSDAEVVDASPNCGERVGDVVTCTIGTLAGGDSATVTITLQFTDDAGSPKTNHAEATSDEEDTFGEDNKDTVVTNPLDVVKTDSDEPVDVGDEVTYTITATNTSDTQLTNVTISDTLPEDADFEGASDDCDQVNGTVTCNVGTLDPNESVTVTITVTFTDEGTHTNNVTVTSDQGGRATDSEPTTVGALAFDKSEIPQTTQAAPADPGDEITYVLTVTNTSDAPVTGVTITDTLPGEPGDTQLARASDNCGPRVGQVITCTIGTLAAGQVATATITVRFTEGGVFPNAAVVAADDGSSAADEEDTFITELADIVVDKSDEDSPATGQEVTWTVTVANDGPNTATDTILTDTLQTAGRVVLVRATSTDPGVFCPLPTGGGTMVVCELGDIESGEEVVVSVVARRIRAGGPAAVNTATAASSTADPDPDNNTDSDRL